MHTTAIYGGSFDPVHNGHAYIIRKLTEEFDRVIVVPCFISPFKAAKQAVPANHRIEMLNLALKSQQLPQEKLPEISTFETDKKGTSYTIDTVRHYSAQGQKLYFVIGTEALPTLHLWKNFDELNKLLTFYAIPRKGFEIQNLDPKIQIEFAPFTPPDDSSALIKPAIALDKAADMLAPPVMDYIKKHGLYRDYKEIADGFTVWNLTPKRIEHTYNTAKYGIYLAKIHGEDVEKTVTAALLHDIGKYADDETLDKYGIKSQIPNMPKPCRHAFIGADIANQYFKISDPDTLNAIRYHTTCRPAMSRLEKIVALADYLEEGRRFFDIDSYRGLSTKDLDAAVLAMLKATIKHLEKNDREIYGLTREALEFYERMKNEKANDE